jgi:2-deoxy-D-gluconate 3-dehydrogenase
MILDQFKLDGKVAIVTGSARGLGQAIAVGLAEAGADVALVDVLPVDDTKKSIERTGRKAVGIKANLLSIDCVPSIVQGALKAFSRIDILVNNAGIWPTEDILAICDSAWDRVIDINLNGPFYLARRVARHRFKNSRKKIGTTSLMSIKRRSFS